MAPTALPQTTLRGTYNTAGARRFTKRLIFSGWTVVPKALACLVSYEAERRRHLGKHAYDDTRRQSEGLTFRRESGRLASFPLLASPSTGTRHPRYLGQRRR